MHKRDNSLIESFRTEKFVMHNMILEKKNTIFPVIKYSEHIVAF